MSNVSQFLASTAPKAITAGGPGSNGYWRRDVYRVPGTFTWTAQKSGKIKIQAIGTGAGASGTYPGASGAFGEKTLSVTAGQTLTVVVGAGGFGSVSSVTSGNGGATSISGTPVGGTPLGLTGALGAKQDATSTFGTAGVATGPWDLSFAGALGTASKGSPASASPFRAGVANPTGGGGAGWGGPGNGSGGGSSHMPSHSIMGAPGLSARGGAGNITPDNLNLNGEARSFWDLRDVDSGGGGAGSGGGSSQNQGGNGGPGAGGGSASSAGSAGGASVLGGGTGASQSSTAAPPKSGHGAGGGANPSQTGGDGGDGLVMIFWDEVQ